MTVIAAIAVKKAELDRLRLRAPGGTRNFDHAQDLKLTYTSNAIEGNTLNAAETTMVVEHGLTIGGKPLKDHLEAIDHFEAIPHVRDLAGQTAPFTEMDVWSVHRLVRPADIAALQAGDEAFDRLPYERLDATLDECLDAVRQSVRPDGAMLREPGRRG